MAKGYNYGRHCLQQLDDQFKLSLEPDNKRHLARIRRYEYM